MLPAGGPGAAASERAAAEGLPCRRVLLSVYRAGQALPQRGAAAGDWQTPGDQDAAMQLDDDAEGGVSSLDAM